MTGAINPPDSSDAIIQQQAAISAPLQLLPGQLWPYNNAPGSLPPPQAASISTKSPSISPNSIGVILSIVFGVVLVFLFFLFLASFFMKRKGRKREENGLASDSGAVKHNTPNTRAPLDQRRPIFHAVPAHPSTRTPNILSQQVNPTSLRTGFLDSQNRLTAPVHPLTIPKSLSQQAQPHIDLPTVFRASLHPPVDPVNEHYTDKISPPSLADHPIFRPDTPLLPHPPTYASMMFRGPPMTQQISG